MMLYKMFTLLASTAHCCIQPLYSAGFEDLHNDVKEQIEQNYMSNKEDEDPQTFEEYRTQTAEWLKDLTLFAVEEHKDFNGLTKQDKLQLAGNLTGIVLQYTYHEIFHNILAVCQLLTNIRENLRELKKLEQIRGSHDQAKKNHMLSQWNKIVENCDVIDTDFGIPNYIPIRELQFFPNIGKISLSRMGLQDKDIPTIYELRSLKNLSILILDNNNFTEIPNFSNFQALEHLNMKGCPLEMLTAKNFKGSDGKNISQCASIKKLSFESSTVESIDLEFFEVFPSIETLDLRDTKITDISKLDEKFWNDHANIQWISFTNCQISGFPKIDDEKNKNRIIGVNWAN